MVFRFEIAFHLKYIFSFKFHKTRGPMKYCADTYSVENSTARSQCLVCLNPWLLLARLCKTVQFTVSCRAHR